MRTSFSEGRTIVELPAQHPVPEPAPEKSTPPFSKADASWITIRFLGVLTFLKVCAIGYDLVVQLGMMFNLFTVASIVGAEPNGQASFQLWIGVILMIAQLLVFGLAAYYLLRKGRALHRVFMFTPRVRS